MESIEGNASVRARPADTAVVIDLRGQLEPTTGRSRAATNGASSPSGPRARSAHRLQRLADRILAAWFGVPAISVDGESGATPVTGRVCGGNSPTKSSDLPPPGRGS